MLKMISYWQAIPKIFITALLLLGIGEWINLDVKSQSRSNYVSNRDIQILKRSGKRWIEINRRSQTLIAWQGNRAVYSVIISTGKAATPTPAGVFKIQAKYPTARMQGEDYNVPDVPHVMYYSGNYAIHGAYWHRSFGIPISHGCTNVAPDHAAWLYSWASVGTTVVVR
jgi:lipoprotein-anchoring transpeptidase ErfK/SrfK